jgi:hypothetical protein
MIVLFQNLGEFYHHHLHVVCKTYFISQLAVAYPELVLVKATICRMVLVKMVEYITI